MTACTGCGGEIEAARQRFQGGRIRHCAECSRLRTNERNRRNKARYAAEGRPYMKKGLVPSPFLHMVASDVGALAELVVSADLLKRGFHVFRAVSPAASCDLLVMRDGQIWRVEVKTAQRSTDGSLTYDKPRDRARFDVLALMVGSDVVYRPDFASLALQAG